MPHPDRFYRSGQLAWRARLRRDLCRANLRIPYLLSLYDRLWHTALLSLPRRCCAYQRGESETRRRLSPATADYFFTARGFLQWLCGAHGHGGDLERHPGVQATGIAQCGDDVDDYGRATGNDVHRDERDGLPLPRASARERDRHLAIRAHYLHRFAGLVLLRGPGDDGAYSGARRQHFFRRFSASLKPAGARPLPAAPVLQPG